MNNFFCKIIVVCTLSLYTGICASQTKKDKKELKRADELFVEGKYREAYNIYSIQYQKKANRDVLLKMAECNYKIENYLEAQNYYSDFFKDSLLFSPPQDYENYARACKLTGNVSKASKVYSNIYKTNPDNLTAKYAAEVCQMFLDSMNTIKVFDLDTNYNCITVDASESVDSLAAPHSYIWEMGDGVVKEGVVVNYCYKNEGVYKIVLSVRDKIDGTLKQNDTAVSVKINHSILNFNSPKKGKLYFYTDFSVEDSTIANCKILEYFWQLGDGTIACEKKIKHKYTEAKVYYPRLTVIAQRPDGGLRLFSSDRRMEITNNVVPFKDSPIYHSDEGK